MLLARENPIFPILYKNRGIIMKKPIRWITETAILLALLITLQTITKPLGQLVTGSCVNAVLAIAVLFAGLGSGLTVAVVSPVLAFLLGIAPQILTVPAIMAGNTVYVLLLHFLADPTGKKVVKNILAWIVAAGVKFAVLYFLVAKVICDFLSASLMEAGTLKAPMLKALPTTFSWPQLFTALIGGGIALLIAPILRKALKK